ncbi:MAG: RnfABCDGE type electron transport complex subunit B [Clostridia bacterium]|nr:RnfABCDGE type electron transport complex subunit B [Clostridia bacterium]
MDPIIYAVLIVSGIGLFAGVGLGIANRFMAVKKNETAEKIASILPGANCGGCGFSGCAGYAEALSQSKNLKTNLCVVGGDKTAKEISELLGVTAASAEKKTAFVKCRGSFDATEKTGAYQGIRSCKAASMLYGGAGACRYGCIGFGDCVDACEYGAMSVRNGVAVADASLCVACGKCVKTCPKRLITLLPASFATAVPCSNPDKGADTRKVCKAGCIGCKMCEKVCESGAITVENGLATIDPDKCTGCGKCAEACKMGVIYSVSRKET